MNHIYIHIPFCLKKCAYCSFYSTTDTSLIDKYVDALIEEIRGDTSLSFPTQLSFPRKRESIKTIYLGGGTPTILSVGQFEKIVESLKSSFNLEENCEFSIEANPETISKDKLIEFKEAGVNRISIGVQSFDDDVLKYLGRIHTAERAKEILGTASDIFDNINIDLIYSFPGQTKESAEKNIETAVGFFPKHISHYELTFEKETRIYKDSKNRDDDDPTLYLHTKSVLESAGYSQYEISNYALPGYECRHNLAYWSDQSYLGLGPSAHSYDRVKNIRWANSSDLGNYIDEDRIAFTEKAKDIDKMIMGLRKTAGMASASIPKQYRDAVDSLIGNGMLKNSRDMISFTPRGTLLANKVLLEIIKES